MSRLPFSSLPSFRAHPDFLGVWAKFDAAKTDLEILDAQIDRHYRDHPGEAVLEADPKPPHYVVKLINTVPAPVLHWGVRVGHVVHDLRSALDHCAWLLASRKLGRTPTDDEAPWIQFPIRQFGRSYPGRYGTHLSATDRAIVDPFQPDARGDDHHPLTVLNRFSNHDKHRVVTLTQPYVDYTGIPVVGDAEVEPMQGVPLEDGAVVAKITAKTKPKFNGNFEQAIYVAFADGTRITPTDEVKVTDDVMNALGLLWNETRRIAKAIQATFL